MANLTIKGLPDELYAALKASAAASRRSIAAEATVMLERALGRRSVAEGELRERGQRLRDETPVLLDPATLRSAIDEGRA
jgi:plasmid stability protein